MPRPVTEQVQVRARGRPRKVIQPGAPDLRTNTAMGQGVQTKCVKREREESDAECLLCEETLASSKSNYVEHHYAKCYYRLGRFSTLYPPFLRDGKMVVDWTEREYRCREEDCSKRPMSHRDLCLHMSTTHGATRTIMALDPTPGIQAVFARIFPEDQYKAGHRLSSEENQNVDQKIIPAAKKIRSDTEEKFMSSEIPPHTETDSGKTKRDSEENITTAVKKRRGPARRKYATEIDKPGLHPSIEEEKLDDPSSESLVQILPTSRETREIQKNMEVEDRSKEIPNISVNSGKLSSCVDYKKGKPKNNVIEKLPFREYKFDVNAMNEILEPPKKFIGTQSCKLCNGTSGKESKNLRVEEGDLADLKNHYLQCYYRTGALYRLVDPGDLNRGVDDIGKPKDETGKQFKYRCPFKNCSKNTGRGAGKNLFSYKDYAIHLGREHGLLEVMMSADDREGIQAVRAVLYQERMKKGGDIEQIPTVDYEEVHKCLLCNSKEGQKLSFKQLTSIRYHYSSCFYALGKYFSLFPPDEENRDIEGKPIDEKGINTKYRCEEAECRTLKKTMGYKELCIHRGVEHGVLNTLLKDSGRQDLLDLVDKIAFYSSKQ